MPTLSSTVRAEPVEAPQIVIRPSRSSGRTEQEPFGDRTRVMSLFPFYSGWWLRADVEHHTIHSFHFINDPRRHERQHLVGQPRPVGRHADHAADRAHGHDVL